MDRSLTRSTKFYVGKTTVHAGIFLGKKFKGGGRERGDKLGLLKLSNFQELLPKKYYNMFSILIYKKYLQCV